MLFGLFFLLPLLLSPGCGSDTPTQPTGVDDPSGGASFDANVDPAAGEFVLKRITVPDPALRPLAIELIGSNLRTDTAEATVTIDVAIRNASATPLYAPLNVHLTAFDPSSVSVLNADDVIIPLPENPGPSIFVFDYGDWIGNDGLLPQETSESRPWVFSDPGLAAFAFEAVAHAGLEPTGPAIGGRLFLDHNQNGRFDAGDDPFSPGYVQVNGPDGFQAGSMANNDGRYLIAVDRAGLYSVRFESLLDAPYMPCYTTPNPLQVLLTVDENGMVSSFLDADFGLLLGPCPTSPAVRLTTADPDSIPQDHYNLNSIELRGDVLVLQVGFSGCQPDHPFTLWAGRNFMESDPVQTWAVLEHDGLGEPCEAYWMRELEFDLSPLRRAYVEQYGQPGLIVLRFLDFQGVEHRFEFGP
jgi:hypothetical protein